MADYNAELKAAREGTQRSSWGECIAQVERLGVPHVTTKAARKPEATSAMGAAKAWWAKRREKPVLALVGPPGTGKSVAAAWLCSKWGEQRPWWTDRPTGSNARPVVWLHASELGRMPFLRAEDEELLRAARSAELLVVDDLEAEGSAAGLRGLGGLLSLRADSGKPTIMTANLVGKSLREAYGDHLADRLARCCMRHSTAGETSKRRERGREWN